LGLGAAVPRGVRGVELHRALVALDVEALGGGAVGQRGRGALAERGVLGSGGSGSSGGRGRRGGLRRGEGRGGQGQGGLGHEVLERTGGEDHVVGEHDVVGVHLVRVQDVGGRQVTGAQRAQIV